MKNWSIYCLAMSVFFLMNSAVAASPDTGSEGHQAKDDAKMRQCILDSGVYVTAASYRDAGRSPQDAFKSMRPTFTQDREPFLKAVINEIYFDSEFTSLHGEYLYRTMVNACINPPHNWKPLE